MAQIIREWISFVPEKVLFATDAYHSRKNSIGRVGLRRLKAEQRERSASH